MAHTKDLRDQRDTNRSDGKRVTLEELMGAMRGDDYPDAITPTLHASVDPENTIVIRDDNTLAAHNFVLTETGLTMGQGATEEDWLWMGDILKRFSDSIQWWVGDWLNEGERFWGHTYQAVAEHFGYDPQTIRKWKYVAKNVSLLIRINKLNWTLHSLVADLPEEDQQYWLEQALRNGMSKRALVAALKGEAIIDPVTERLDQFRRAAIGFKDDDRERFIDGLRQLLWELENA